METKCEQREGEKREVKWKTRNQRRKQERGKEESGRWGVGPRLRMAPNLFHWACSREATRARGDWAVSGESKGSKRCKMGRTGQTKTVNSQVRGSLAPWPLSPLSIFFFEDGPSLTGWMQVRSFGRPQREDFLVLGIWGDQNNVEVHGDGRLFAKIKNESHLSVLRTTCRISLAQFVSCIRGNTTHEDHCAALVNGCLRVRHGTENSRRRDWGKFSGWRAQNCSRTKRDNTKEEKLLGKEEKKNKRTNQKA